MNPSELVDHIRSGPAELVLDKPLRFRRRTRSNPCDFNEFLQALESSEMIQDVFCASHLKLDILEDEWVLLVKTIGRIRDIPKLKFSCRAGSSDFHPFQAVADAVNNARSLRNLAVELEGESFPGDSSGLTALANSLKELIALQGFTWFDFVSRLEAAPAELSLDLVLRALPACPHLRMVTILTNYASADAFRSLLQLTPATELRLILELDQWLAVTDGIRQGRCNAKQLYLALLVRQSSEATEAIKAVASAIRWDRNLKSLTLQMKNDFTDEAGVALAEALTVNKSLLKVALLNPLRHIQ
jgi:hypothetical protein